jgi:hypothetical protein
MKLNLQYAVVREWLHRPPSTNNSKSTSSYDTFCPTQICLHYTSGMRFCTEIHAKPAWQKGNENELKLSKKISFWIEWRIWQHGHVFGLTLDPLIRFIQSKYYLQQLAFDKHPIAIFTCKVNAFKSMWLCDFSKYSTCSHILWESATPNVPTLLSASRANASLDMQCTSQAIDMHSRTTGMDWGTEYCSQKRGGFETSWKCGF